MSGAVVCLALGLAVLTWPEPHRGRVPGPAGRRVAAAMERARFPAPAAVGGPLLVGVAVAGGVGVAATPLVGALAGGGAVLAVRSWRRRQETARTDQAVLALADLLGALSAELRSGRPVSAAVDAALGACADARCRAWAAPVLRAAMRGDPLPEATWPGPEPFAGSLARVCGAVRLSSRTGCSLAAVLATVEDDLRARRRQALEARAATAGPRASAALLAGLPVLALAMGHGVGADPWRVLTTTSVGQALLVVGVALEAAGVYWSGRLVRRALR